MKESDDNTMDLLSRQQLSDLARMESGCCVSLYMPTFRFESNQEQNPIRYRNLLKEARRQLKACGYREGEASDIVQPAQDVLENTLFWRSVSDGLVAFLTADSSSVYRLPLDFEELVVTGGHFHLKPLFPLIASNNRFYVLALSQNHVRLYQGTHHAISEVEAKEIPKSILDAILKFEEPERQVLSHTSGRSGGRPDITPHGQAPQSEDASHQPKDHLRRFFQEIDEGVRGVLEDETAPLVLAGVEYYLPIYREVNGYAHLVKDEIVAGNPEHLNPKDLHGKSWEVVEPLFQQSQQESLDQFQQRYHNGGGLASADLCEIIPAAVFSRVETLFVPIGEHRWGHYDPEANAVELHEQQQPGDEDLLNLAAIHTYLNGGTVHALQAENMPVEEPLAATFRYAADVAATEA